MGLSAPNRFERSKPIDTDPNRLGVVRWSAGQRFTQLCWFCKRKDCGLPRAARSLANFAQFVCSFGISESRAWKLLSMTASIYKKSCISLLQRPGEACAAWQAIRQMF